MCMFTSLHFTSDMFVSYTRVSTRESASPRPIMAAPSGVSGVTPDDAPVLTATSWEDRRWWSGALHRASALDYFAGSPFYERTCLNELLKMQKTLTPEAVLEKLKRLPGIVYELDEARTEEVPPSGDKPAHMLYVIRKLKRDGKGKETTLREYYVLDGLVYEAPTMEAIMRTRLLKMSWHLYEAWKLTAAGSEQSSQLDSAAAGKNKRRRDDE